MNCWICSTRGCPRNKNSPVDAGLFRTCAERPRDGRAISAARFPHISCHTLPPPPVICETPRHAPPFPSYRCHFAHLRACFPRLSTHPQTAPLMLHYQRFSTLINPPQLSCHGSIAICSPKLGSSFFCCVACDGVGCCGSLMTCNKPPRSWFASILAPAVGRSENRHNRQMRIFFMEEM